MKAISARELRQNPSRMIHDVEAGETYSLTLHGRRVGMIVPEQMATRIVPAKKTGPLNTSVFARHELRTADSIDDLLQGMKGEGVNVYYVDPSVAGRIPARAFAGRCRVVRPSDR